MNNCICHIGFENASGIAIMAYQNVTIIGWHELATKQLPITVVVCNLLIQVQQEML